MQTVEVWGKSSSLERHGAVDRGQGIGKVLQSSGSQMWEESKFTEALHGWGRCLPIKTQLLKWGKQISEIMAKIIGLMATLQCYEDLRIKVVWNVMFRRQLTYDKYIVKTFKLYIKPISKKANIWITYLLTVSATKPWIRDSFFVHMLSIHAGLVIC